MRTKQEAMLRYLQKNPLVWSMTVVKDGELLRARKPDTYMSAMGVLSMMHAVAFTKATARGEVDPKSTVPLAEVERFYYAKKDKQAYQTWVKAQQITTTVSLAQIVDGMLTHNVLACTDYLYYVLGHTRVNEVINEYGMAHSLIRSVVGHELLPAYLLRYKKVPRGQLGAMLTTIDAAEHEALADEILQRLAKGELRELLSKAPIFFVKDVQFFLQAKLPVATTKMYAYLVPKVTTGGEFWQHGGTKYNSNAVSYVNGVSVALFIYTYAKRDIRWLTPIMKDFMIAFHHDPVFQEKVLEML